MLESGDVIILCVFQLSSIEWSMAKSRQAEAMNIAEQKQYGKVPEISHPYHPHMRRCTA